MFFWGPGGCRLLREACRIHFYQFWFSSWCRVMAQNRDCLIFWRPFWYLASGITQFWPWGAATIRWKKSAPPPGLFDFCLPSSICFRGLVWFAPLSGFKLTRLFHFEFWCVLFCLNILESLRDKAKAKQSKNKWLFKLQELYHEISIQFHIAHPLRLTGTWAIPGTWRCCPRCGRSPTPWARSCASSSSRASCRRELHNCVLPFSTNEEDDAGFSATFSHVFSKLYSINHMSGLQ